MSEFKPTGKQKALIKIKESALIIAGPGTGKTRTAVEKARVEVHSFDENSAYRVLFLSFSNAAIYRLLSSANIVFSRNEKHYLRFMTFHSCAADILRNYGRFVGLPSKIKIMDTLEEKFIAFEKGWTNLDKDYYKKLQTLAKTEGLLAFSVLIDFAIKLFTFCNSIREIIGRKYKMIIVDEFQDSSEEQWKLLRLLGQNSQVIAFGDPNQIIYSSMHSATRRRFEEFKKWKQIEETSFSSTNFRCKDDEILLFADCLLNATPYNKVKNSNVHLFELNYRSQLRIKLALIWKAIHEQVGVNQTIGILAPTASIAENVSVSLRNPKKDTRLPIPIYTRLSRDQTTQDALFLALAAIRDYSLFRDKTTCRKAAMALLAMDLTWNTRKNLSLKKIKTVTGLLEKCSSTTNTKLYNLMNSIRTQPELDALLPDLVQALSEISEFHTTAKKIYSYGYMSLEITNSIDSQLSLFDKIRSTRQPKGLEGYAAGVGKTHCLNYHKAKGREFDFVIMIVDPRGESRNVSLDEKRRLYYVCSTRAKKWLGVIYYMNELGPVLGPVILPTEFSDKKN
jgi:superfamily I DNA/RNA helicase